MSDTYNIKLISDSTLEFIRNNVGNKSSWSIFNYLLLARLRG